MDGFQREIGRGAQQRVALPEPTAGDIAYNQRAWAPYFHALTSSGAVGVPIPLSESPATILRLLDTCAGVLLPGSPADLDPGKYGERALPECAPQDAVREGVDALLLEHAHAQGKPVFGICYGLQSINVWRGGSLLQHLPLVTSVDHDPGPQVLSAHGVRIDRASELHRVIGKTSDLLSMNDPEAILVNSSHHQAIERLGRELAVSARCLEDGGIEGIEGTDPSRFLLAVQWHPERSYDESEASRHLFRGFVNACASYGEARRQISAAV